MYLGKVVVSRQEVHSSPADSGRQVDAADHATSAVPFTVRYFLRVVNLVGLFADGDVARQRGLLLLAKNNHAPFLQDILLLLVGGQVVTANVSLDARLRRQPGELDQEGRDEEGRNEVGHQGGVQQGPVEARHHQGARRGVEKVALKDDDGDDEEERGDPNPDGDEYGVRHGNDTVVKVGEEDVAGDRPRLDRDGHQLEEDGERAGGGREGHVAEEKGRVDGDDRHGHQDHKNL